MKCEFIFTIESRDRNILNLCWTKRREEKKRKASGWSFRFLGILENIGNVSLEIFFKLRGSWLSLEQRLLKFLFGCHLQIIWLLVNRTLYVVLITEGRLEIRNSTLKAVKVGLKLMCIGSKGGIFSRWSSVSSERKKKKKQEHKHYTTFTGKLINIK